MYLASKINELPAVLPLLESHSKFNDADYLAFMCHEIGTPLTARLR